MMSFSAHVVPAALTFGRFILSSITASFNSFKSFLKPSIAVLIKAGILPKFLILKVTARSALPFLMRSRSLNSGSALFLAYSASAGNPSAVSRTAGNCSVTHFSRASAYLTKDS